VIKQYFINTADPAHDPDKYIALVTKLLDLCNEQRFVMNTCGWVDGFGAVMLQEILKQLPR
jgi:polynucleotide 5'-kinase involved in rRNA processing